MSADSRSLFIVMLTSQPLLYITYPVDKIYLVLLVLFSIYLVFSVQRCGSGVIKFLHFWYCYGIGKGCPGHGHICR